ncbi:MAG: response regulator transcription factor [Clostridia bacterium]|nr:response regulator transcription factor [Clostridia bacterium]
MKKIRVLICDDLPEICEAYKERMEFEDDFECIGAVSCAGSCIDAVKRLSPDLLLLDIQMETKTAGIKALAEIKKSFPETKVIMLTGYDDEEYILSAFANGADDYFVKSLSMDDLLDTMRDVYNDRGKIRVDIAQKLAQQTKRVMSRQNSIMYMFTNIYKLTSSEVELLKSIRSGKTYNQLAEEKFVEPNTIRKKASRILKKCEHTQMSELIQNLEDMGIFEMLK